MNDYEQIQKLVNNISDWNKDKRYNGFARDHLREQTPVLMDMIKKVDFITLYYKAGYRLKIWFDNDNLCIVPVRAKRTDYHSIVGLKPRQFLAMYTDYLVNKNDILYYDYDNDEWIKNKPYLFY